MLNADRTGMHQFQRGYIHLLAINNFLLGLATRIL